jgi:hypothetical protein
MFQVGQRVCFLCVKMGAPASLIFVIFFDIFKYRCLRETYKTGLDWMIGFIDTLYIHNSGLQAIQRYRYSTHFSVRRYTRTRVLGLH